MLRGSQVSAFHYLLPYFLLCIWLFACQASCLFSQQLDDFLIQAEHYSVEEGLSHRNVRGICQDQRGMMWFGTAYGLNRFDGYEFKWFTAEQHGLASNDIQHIHLDQKGNIWIIYGNINNRSIDIFNPITESVQSFSAYFGAEAPFELGEVVNYQAGPNASFAFLLPDQLIHFTDEFNQISLAGKHIQKGEIFFGKGEFWLWEEDELGKKNKLLHVNEQGIVREHDLDFGWEFRYMDVFEVEQDGSIRISDIYHVSANRQTYNRYLKISSDGLVKIDTVAEDVFNQYQIHITSPRFFIRKIGSNYWVSSIDQKFRIIPAEDAQAAIEFSEKYPELRTAYCIFEDASGTVWVGTEFGFFSFQFKKKQFTNVLSQQSGTEGFAMRSLAVTGKGTSKSMWGMVQSSRELWKVNLESGEEERIKSFESNRCALDLTENGELLFVSKMGIEQMNPQSQQATHIYPHDFLTLSLSTWKIHLDKYGALWFDLMDYGSLFRDKAGKLESFEEWTGAPGTAFLYQFIENETDTVWLVTDKGLFRLHLQTGEVIERFWKEGEGRFHLPYDNIHHMWIEETYCWLATAGNGLVKWHPEQGVLQRYTRANGLSNNTLYAAYPDAYGNIWLPSDYGINVLEIATGRIRTYTTQDGICHNEFNRISHHMDEEGYLYFGTLDGVSIFHPRDFIADTTQLQPPMAITSFQQFDGDQGMLVDKTAELIETGSILLQPNDPLIRLDFALLSYDQLENVQYAYFIEGVDNDWVYQKENNLRLARLPYGSHLLRIKGQAASGQWSTEEIRIQVLSLKPFYLESWFFISVLLIVLAAVFLISRYRERSLREQRARLEKTVQDRTATIEQQKEELKSLDELKSRFFANVSHELRTPLTLILGPLNRIIKSGEKRAPKEAELLQFMHRNSQHLLKLVNEILDLSKLEKGKLEIDWEPVNLGEFLKLITDQFSAYAESKGIDFHQENHVDAGLSLLLDRTKVEKIIFNFISNALKFTPSGGRVSLITREEEESILVKVEDTGSGIAPEDLPYVFDRFFQTQQKNKAPQGGTGIGLSLARELAELLGGSVGVTSELGQGSSFWVRFPKEIFADKPQPIEVEAPLTFAKKEQEKAVAKPATQAPKILLVEDNVELRQYLQTILEEDYHCQTAENGQLAWDFLKQAARGELPDLIISDVMMPVMDGIELVEKIKADDLLCQIPVIMLTARADIQVKIHSLRTGVDDYITKPFHEEELLVRIANLLKNYAGRQAALNADQEQQMEAADVPAISQEDRNWLQDFESYIQQNVANDLVTVPYLAEQFAMSESTLRRQLNRLTGLSPKQYLQEVRLDSARQLLENRAFRTVAQVASRAGFANQRTFTRNYKERFGKNPSEYIMN